MTDYSQAEQNVTPSNEGCDIGIKFASVIKLPSNLMVTLLSKKAPDFNQADYRSQKVNFVASVLLTLSRDYFLAYIGCSNNKQITSFNDKNIYSKTV